MRIRSVDWFRGFVVVLMIIYHYFAIAYLMTNDLNWIYSSLTGYWFGQFIRISFLILVGVSTRLMLDIKGEDEFLKVNNIRFAKISMAGALITAVSYVLYPDVMVYWGILHLIAVAVLILGLAKWFHRFYFLLLGFSLIIFTKTALAKLGVYNSSYLIPIGAYPDGFASLDYFPILPWLGVPLIGYGLSTEILKAFKKVNWKMPILEWIGKRALAIYILHTPFVYMFWVLSNYLL